MTPTTPLSNKENCVEPVTSSDPINLEVPVNPEVMRTPVSQKFVDKSQVKVLNPVNCSPLSELLVYPTCAKKQIEVKKYVACVLTNAESIALLEEKNKRN